MNESNSHRLAVLERRQKWNCAATAAALFLAAFLAVEPRASVKAQSQREPLTVPEIAVIDSRGTVRVRIAGDLPDAVVEGKPRPRGQRAAGVLLYDATGTERSGYVTFEPSGNVGLTLDTRKSQVASFIAGPESTGALRLFTKTSAVELRAEQDGPSIHAVHKGKVAFHEPPVENPQSTEMCKALRAATNLPAAQLLDACRARTSEAACQACLNK